MKKESPKDWVYNYLYNLIISNEGGFEHADNFRIARKNDFMDVLAYNEQKDKGCCGGWDGKIFCPIDGEFYLIGFNYGH